MMSLAIVLYKTTMGTVSLGHFTLTSSCISTKQASFRGGIHLLYLIGGPTVAKLSSEAQP
jgi:hypothetical protein